MQKFFTLKAKLIFGFLSIIILSMGLQFTSFESNQLNFFMLASALVVVSSIIASLIIRSILNPINSLSDIIKEIEASSDLSRRIEIKSKDEIGATAQAFNDMLDKFQAFVQQVNSSSAQLTTAADQVSTIANQSSAQVNNQLVETDAVATAMNEMSATVTEVSRNGHNLRPGNIGGLTILAE